SPSSSSSMTPTRTTTRTINLRWPQGNPEARVFGSPDSQSIPRDICCWPSAGRRLNSDHAMKTAIDSIEAVIEDLRKGKLVIVVDDADRENEGDLIMAAEHATPEAITFMAKHDRARICVPTTAHRPEE